MKTCMLSYSKLILEKVSFSKELYEKEYKKALQTLSDREAQLLQDWVLHKKSQLNSAPVSVVK